MPETHSKLAVALAEVAYDLIGRQRGKFYSGEAAEDKARIASAIDERLAKIREAYKPEAHAFCPVVTHHGPSPCAFCVTAAMRAFILLPSDLDTAVSASAEKIRKDL